MSLLINLFTGVCLALTYYFGRKAYDLQREVVNLRVNAAFNMNLNLQQAIDYKQAQVVSNAKLAGIFFLFPVVRLVGSTLMGLAIAGLVCYVFFRFVKK